MTTAEPGPSAGGTALDPAKHALSVRRYDGNGAEHPMALTRYARQLRRDLESDRRRLTGPRGGRHVVLSEVRAVVIASLLEELAARLRPGPTFGPSTEGREMARVIAGLVAELIDQAIA